MSTPTPRSDALQRNFSIYHVTDGSMSDLVKLWDLARELERELSTLRTRLAAAEEDGRRLEQLRTAIQQFLNEYAKERQPHGGVDDDPPSGDTIAFHARRILGRAVKAIST